MLRNIDSARLVFCINSPTNGRLDKQGNEIGANSRDSHGYHRNDSLDGQQLEAVDDVAGKDARSVSNQRQARHTISGEGGSTVEAEPSEPQERGAEHHHGQAVRTRELAREPARLPTTSARTIAAVPAGCRRWWSTG